MPTEDTASNSFYRSRLGTTGTNQGYNQGGDVYNYANGGEMDLRNQGGTINDQQGSGSRDTVPAQLADGEFVLTKQSVKGIGNGDHEKGVEYLYQMMRLNENKAQQMGLGRA